MQVDPLERRHAGRQAADFADQGLATDHAEDMDE